MKSKKIYLGLVALSLLGIGLSACGSKKENADASTGKVTVVGSTALQPLVEAAAEDFQKDNSGINVTVQGGGSGTGLSQVAAGAVEIGNSDIFAEQKDGLDASQLTDHKVAVVGMVPVVNPDVHLKELTMTQLKEIFTGKITNWQEVGGPDEAITVINRAQGSGTRATFEANVLAGAEAVTAQEQDSSGTVQKIVATTPGAISYLAFSYLTDDVQALVIDGIEPTDENVTTNDWKIWSYEHMYTKGTASGATKKFLDYMNSDAVQKNLVGKLGYISINEMKVEKDAHNQLTNP